MLNRQWFYRRQGDEAVHGEGHAKERKVGWLELFYDLVYVAALIQLGNSLSHDVSVGGFVRFVALFIPIWLAWTGIMFYVNRFTIDDVGHRLLVFAQMVGVTVMAVSLEGVFGDHFQQFVLAYVAVRLILVLLYVRAWFAVPEARSLVAGFGLGFFLGAAIWFISIFFPEPINYILWVVGLLAELIIPLTPGAVRWQQVFPPHVGHMTERYGIFTIIVLGESFVKAIDSLAGTTVDLSLALVGIGGLIVLFCLWWLYFDDIGGSAVSNMRVGPYVWIYSHLPIAMGITAYGVALKKLVQEPAGEPLPDEYRLLVCAALILFLFFLALVDRVTARADRTLPNPVRGLWRLAAVAVFVALALLGGGMTPAVFAVAAALVFLAQIAFHFRGGGQAGVAAHTG